MRIAICDDNPKDLAVLREFANKYFANQCNIFEFNNSKDLEDKSDTPFDLYLLDVLIDSNTGIDIAKKIRQMNIDSPIIFVTSSEEFALDAFAVDAIQYLIKPLNYTAFTHALDKTKLKDDNSNCYVLVKTKQGNTAIKISTIEYIEYTNRRLRYVLKNKKEYLSVSVRTNFEDSITFDLPSYFFYTHKSYLVNYNEVATLTKNSFVMKNGLQVPIARSKYNEVKQTYIKFLSKDLEESN